ncbi:hypothetical protein F3N42_05740 [Marinihelvus fidelis]|uniref:Peptidase M61 catalytic domain-containing protein n=1 Tax=Marinihelvus fidelis TaxID=2613842 RepID=A0A5N0TCI2_9GAMM|nr:hypothetical protein F3N42_05740 [Marinihelvus fidelis]
MFSRALVALALLWFCGTCLSDNGERVYDISYRVTVDPRAGVANVRLNLRQDDDYLREMRFDQGLLEAINGDGDVVVDDGQVTWSPPANGGRLSWRVPVLHERDSGEYDAWLDDDWGLFRLEDVIPRAATRTQKSAQSNTVLKVQAPAGWSVVTPYAGNDKGSSVTRPGRRFSQPTGWLVMGELGVRRERIAGTRVVIAGPTSQDVRRMDMLALLNWTLPELSALLPEPLPRLTVISAGEPMWRGALSAPNSLYIHAERPMISGNGTSSLLHEVLHVALSMDSAPGYDWIVEGLAEYYSLELLRRSGTITPKRYQHALKDLAQWSAKSDELCGGASTGATTARAVMVFRDIDAALRAGGDNNGLDDVLGQLLGNEDLDLDALRTAVSTVAGDEAATRLDDGSLPGCERND